MLKTLLKKVLTLKTILRKNPHFLWTIAFLIPLYATSVLKALACIFENFALFLADLAFMIFNLNSRVQTLWDLIAFPIILALTTGLAWDARTLRTTLAFCLAILFLCLQPAKAGIFVILNLLTLTVLHETWCLWCPWWWWWWWPLWWWWCLLWWWWWRRWRLTALRALLKAFLACLTALLKALLILLNEAPLSTNLWTFLTFLRNFLILLHFLTNLDLLGPRTDLSLR